MYKAAGGIEVMADKPKKSTPKSAAKKSSVANEGSKSNASANSTKKVGGGTKSNPVTAERLKAAEDVIKNKPVKSKKADNPSTEALKKRAAEAKKRAQDKILDEAYVSDPAHPLERLANTFDNSTRRWEMIIYPSMFAFILLASYGFYLIYHLTHDISVLSKSVTNMAAIVSESMPEMAGDLRGMTGSIDNMTVNVNGMTGDLSKMTDQMSALRPMNANLANMTDTMGSMNRSVYGMHRDVGNMNQTVSGGPFGMMNDVMPFSSNSYNRNVPPPPMYIPPAIAPPPKRPAKPGSSALPVVQSKPAAMRAQ